MRTNAQPTPLAAWIGIKVWQRCPCSFLRRNISFEMRWKTWKKIHQADLRRLDLPFQKHQAVRRETKASSQTRRWFGLTSSFRGMWPVRRWWKPRGPPRTHWSTLPAGPLANFETSNPSKSKNEKQRSFWEKKRNQKLNEQTVPVLQTSRSPLN